MRRPDEISTQECYARDMQWQGTLNKESQVDRVRKGLTNINIEGRYHYKKKGFFRWQKSDGNNKNSLLIGNFQVVGNLNRQIFSVRRNFPVGNF